MADLGRWAKKHVSVHRREQFEVEAKKAGFSVRFSRDVARVIEYKDTDGSLRLTTDSGSKGDHSIAIDPLRGGGSREKLALERTKRFLEACGFEVELPS